jgi:hypothetical protein
MNALLCLDQQHYQIHIINIYLKKINKIDKKILNFAVNLYHLFDPSIVNTSTSSLHPIDFHSNGNYFDPPTILLLSHNLYNDFDLSWNFVPIDHLHPIFVSLLS